MKKTLFFILAIFCMAVMSCQKNTPLQEFVKNSDGTYTVNVSAETPEFTGNFLGGSATKATDTQLKLDEAFQKINNTCAFMYKNGVLYKSWYAEGSSLKLSFPENESVNLYLVGNVGDITLKEDGEKAFQSESEMMSYTYEVANYEEFMEKGFPIAKVNKHITPANLSSTSFKLQYLVSLYEFSYIKGDSVKDSKLDNFRIVNAALNIRPFNDEELSPTDIKLDTDGFYLPEEQIKKINNGESVVLYFIENKQGTISNPSQNPIAKTPNWLPDENRKKKCTFIEINTTCHNLYDETNQKEHKFYLGENNFDDFNIIRSRYKKLILKDEFENFEIFSTSVNIAQIEEVQLGGNLKVSFFSDMPMINDQRVMVVYFIYNSTPTHIGAEQAGMAYFNYLSQYSIGQMVVQGVIKAGETEGSVTVPVPNIENGSTSVAHLKRMSIYPQGDNTSGYEIINFIPMWDVTLDTDDFVHVVKTEPNDPYTPKYLGTLFYEIYGHDMVSNPDHPDRYDRIATLKLSPNNSNGFLPSISSCSIDFGLYSNKLGTPELLGTIVYLGVWTEKDNSIKIALRSNGLNNNGYTADEIGGTFFKLISYSVIEEGSGYYRLIPKQ